MRGTQKRVVYLKNTGSDIFEEAYFIIKEKTDIDILAAGENDLIKEASRIINENSGKKQKNALKRITSQSCAFIIGVLISFIVTVILFK